MKNFHKIILTFFTLVFALSISNAYAQDAELAAKKTTAFSPYFYVNGSLGYSTFWGDLSSPASTTEFGSKSKLFQEPRFGGSFSLGHQFSPIFGARFNMLSTRTRSRADNRYYEGQFTDFSAQLTVDFTNIFRNNYDTKFSLYGFGGVGFMMHSGNVFIPGGHKIYQPYYSGTDYSDFKSTPFVFPFGLGAKYALNEDFGITFETGLHYTNSDDLEKFEAADPAFYKMDGAWFTSLGLTYKFNNGIGANFSPSTSKSFDPFLYASWDLGFTNFFGDIYSDNVLGSESMFGWGVKAGYQFHPVLGLRLNVANGQLQAQSETLKFKSVFSDWSAQLTFDFTNFFRDDYNARFNLYGFVGAGRSYLEGYEYDMTDGNAVSGGMYHVYIFPAGLGMSYGLTENLDINIETSTRFTFDDILERTTGGNMMFVNDRYQLTTLGFTYKMGDLFGNINRMIRDHGKVIYKVTPEVLQERGGKTPYEVTVTFPENYFLRNAAVNVAPVLKYGDKELALVSQSFYGEKVANGSGQMVPYATGGTYTFKGVFDFIPEMAASTVEVNPVVYAPKVGKENEYKNLAVAQFKIGDGVIHTEDWAGGNEVSLLAAHGYDLETIVSKAAKLYFPVNLFSYDSKFGINKTATATTAREDLNKLLATGMAFKNIKVNAYASPEGEETFNANLSSNRAKFGESYVRSEFQKLIKAKGSLITIKDLKVVPFTVVGHGPDWDGFMTALSASAIAEKSTILNVVKSASAAKKEQEIRNMILIYPELENILATLRRAEITVNVFESKRSAEQIAAFATTKPGDLTVEELLYAATLTEDVKAQTGIYKSAANLFPNSWESQANYGYVETLNGNYSSALTYFEKANTLSPNNGTVLNNMGVVYAKQGNWVKAKKSFTDAQKLGVTENYNLGVVAIQFGEYEKALELFGSKKCDVNVGLAQLMLEKYKDAKANLSCAVETCKTNYLLAVVGARTANDAEVFAGLKKAFEMNPKFKGMAMNDREFIRYFENAEFMSLVK